MIYILNVYFVFSDRLASGSEGTQSLHLVEVMNRFVVIWDSCRTHSECL